MQNKNRQAEFFVTIMAGGGGTRLWPWSRKGQPKQMLRIVGGRSMFQLTVDRLEGLVDPSHILVITTADQAEGLQKQVPEIKPENYIIEPLPRGTASVVGLGAAHIAHRCGNAVMAVLTADHYIKEVEMFRTLLTHAREVAEEGHLVTLGIKPSFPSTAMGYIEQGDLLETKGEQEVYRVKRFTEKPDHERAEKFIQSGNYNWNSGMFIWQVQRIEDEIRLHMPELNSQLEVIRAALSNGTYQQQMAETWPQINPITIDYGIMEKAEDVVVLPAHSLGWNDIGSWESIYGVVPEDKDGNIHINCKSVSFDSQGTLVCSENPDKMIITVGLRNMVIVETDHAVLVCQREDTQRVREIVAYLKENKFVQYL